MNHATYNSFRGFRSGDRSGKQFSLHIGQKGFEETHNCIEVFCGLFPTETNTNCWSTVSTFSSQTLTQSTSSLQIDQVPNLVHSLVHVTLYYHHSGPYPRNQNPVHRLLVVVLVLSLKIEIYSANMSSKDTDEKYHFGPIPYEDSDPASWKGFDWSAKIQRMVRGTEDLSNHVSAGLKYIAESGRSRRSCKFPLLRFLHSFRWRHMCITSELNENALMRRLWRPLFCCPK